MYYAELEKYLKNQNVDIMLDIKQIIKYTTL